MIRRTIYLARHGETPWNKEGRWQGHTDVALNEEGRLQAHALGRALVARGIVRAHASDLLRARETGEIIATLLGLPPLATDPGLRERGFGVFEGLTREESEARFPEAWALYKAGAGDSPPGGEPREEVVARMRASVQALAQALRAHHPDTGAALAISHGGAMRLLVKSITGELPPP
ncbi:MAG TPA: histidine phosphatase family protein, partial [Polyangia bacterium]|nr:histidine phosphatase family protein [Polyangia bacterium]